MRTIQGLRNGVRRGAASCVAMIWVVASHGGALANDEPVAGAPSASEAPANKAPIVSLDKLLRIPDSVTIEVDRRGGATRSEWRERFVEARQAVVEEKQNLDESLDKLTDLASNEGNWRIAAPGVQAATDDTTPMNFGLKQQIRRDRESVERAERDLIDLKVEANLAGVPNEWWMER